MGWKSAAALMTLTFFGLGSLVYLLFRHDYDEPDCFLLNNSKVSAVEIKVPIESIGIIIGRGGNTIKEIELKSASKIHLKEDDNPASDYKICVIKGTPEATQYAQLLIHELIVSQPLITTHEFYIPTEACKAVIGKNGDNIRLISRNSNAKIMIENAISSEVPLERKILIKGTSEQIGTAKYLIEQKVEEYFEFCKTLETQLSNRPMRNKSKYLLPAKGETEKEELLPKRQKFIATSSNGLLEVYVSALESPNQFWLQMMGPCTVELDKLVDQMTAYYSDETNRNNHILKEVKIGQIIAAPFAYDSKWYRAEVQELISDSEVTDEPNVLIYYVDYGDSSKCKKSSLHELRTDFLRLRFQAIECCLAKVKPKDSYWTEEAIDFLEDLTHVALWKSVMAKIHSYQNRSSGLKRQGSPLPCVELYDIQGDKTIDVAEELVRKGFAVWDVREHSPTPSSENILN